MNNKSCCMCKYLGKQVSWHKIYAEPDAFRYEKEGFGSFHEAKIGNKLRISGDYGIVTSTIKSLEFNEVGMMVKTENSTYMVKVY